MTEDEIIEQVRALAGVVVVRASEEGGAPEVAWGDSFFFYDPDGTTDESRRMPFATIVTGDYPGFDTASNLDRPGVFRLNLWVARATATEVGEEAAGADPTELDRVIPHPIYGAQSWVSVLNPGERTSARAMALLREAYDQAVHRWERKSGSG